MANADLLAVLSTGREGLCTQLRELADDGRPCINDHDLLPRRVVGVKLAVPLVEPLNDVADEVSRVDVDVGDGHGDLVDLLAVSHVEGALHLDLPVEPVESGASLTFHVAENLSHSLG